jgi:diguanylate cyclase (GGDEF)-like protein
MNDINKDIESAITDPQTGLNNFPYFLRRLKMGISCSRRHKIPVVSIVIQFDINTESKEGLAGEERESALKFIGNVINNSIRWDSDLAGRIEEDKIGIVLMQCKKEEAMIIVNRILDNFKRNNPLAKKDGSKINISLKIGHIFADLSHDSLSLLKEAEENVVVNAII